MNFSSDIQLRDRVEQAIEQCRPYLQRDHGDVELVGVSEGGIVEVRFSGTCVTCPMSSMTLRAGLERVILQCVPEVRRVEALSREKESPRLETRPPVGDAGGSLSSL